MADNVGPLCITQVGSGWVDKGTHAQTKNQPSAPRGIYVCGTPAHSAAKAVMDTLADAAVAKINFTIDGFAVSSTMYANVARLVREGKVVVAYDASLSGCAYYDQNANRLEVNFTTASTLTKRALVIHESTHTVFDAKPYAKATVAISEAAAYIAQCIFAKVYAAGPDERLYDDEDAKDLVFEKAWLVAGKIIVGQTPNAADYAALKTAMAARPDYPNASRLSGWNGI
jgi:hypothetical protein